MDAAFIFRQGLESVIQRPPHPAFFQRKPFIPPLPHPRDDTDSDAPHRIAHTLTACCRCRQRKTRCDPAIPKCLPCERSGSICEYFDASKGKKIGRIYVVKLQQKVRELEAELRRFTEEDEDESDPIARPGGLVRLNETDETPRYLGPSSGIAMTRLLMEEAKRYSDSKRIADLIPQVSDRRRERENRMQSVVSMSGMAGSSVGRKSYPKTSDVAAKEWPSRRLLDGLVEAFKQRGQTFIPVLHKKALTDDVEAVLAGDTDPYKNFVLWMVLATSLQKIEETWAGLADSYYLAAMQHFEEVVRLKDLRTLQCLVLIGQYSLLTPTRTAVYYTVGLAVRMCQQMGLSDEKTIALGISDPWTIDLRRRLSWAVTTQEFGLAHIMGRPNGFAKCDDMMNVQFFEMVDDDNITPEGITPGPVSEDKAVAVHFCKMRLLQAEIRRVLYENKRQETMGENDPWFAQMNQKIDEWLESIPKKPEWAKAWFTGRYQSMVVTIYRPSPQVPKPSSDAALKCFDAAECIIGLGDQQVANGAIDLTYIFLLTVYMSLNTLLWAISYPEVREKRAREDVEKLVATATELVRVCAKRWPGAESAEHLYTVFAGACLRSYDQKETPPAPPADVASSFFGTPTSLADANSPESETTPTPSQPTLSQPYNLHNPHNPPPFGYVFGATTEEMTTHYAFDNGPPGFQPNFRSNSIFHNPTTDSQGRRGSYFPPDFTHSEQPQQGQGDDSTPPGTAMSQNSLTPPGTGHMANALPTPPESLSAPSVTSSSHTLSPAMHGLGLRTASPTPTPTMPRASPVPISIETIPVPPPRLEFETSNYAQSRFKQEMPPPPPRAPLFTIPQQRGAATPVHNWHDVPMPLISSNTFSGGMNNGFWADNASLNSLGPLAGLGLTGNENYTAAGGRNDPGFGLSGDLDGDLDMFSGPTFSGGYHQQRHGSLSLEQQQELSSVLEAEGMSDIDSFLSAAMGYGGGGGGTMGGGVQWA